VGLLNPGGPIAQFKRNRCSISPVEVILLSGVRSKEKTVLRHDLKRIAKFFSGTAENKKSGECYSANSSHS